MREVQVIVKWVVATAWLATISAICVAVLAGTMFGEVLSATIVTRSNDPILTSLTVSAGTLSPEFSGTQVNYTVSDVPYGARVLTITAVPEPDAIVTYWHYPDGSIAELVDEDTMTDGFQVSLDIGQKIVEVSITKGSRYRDYRLEITRLKPTVSIRAVSETPVYEGETLEFEIRRSAAAKDPLAVRVLAREMEAEVGAGHANVLADEVDGRSPEYYIEGGNSTATIEMETNGDSAWENHSRVEMSIVADELYTIKASAGSAAIVVQDDEFPASTGILTVSPNPVGEGAGSATASVTVTTTEDRRPHGEASVAVVTSDGTAEAGSDYTGVDTSVTFTEADFSSVMVDVNTMYRATKTVDVTITQDTDDEIDETFNIIASTEMGSPISVEADDSTVSVTITDDDEPPTSAPTLTSLSVSAGTLTPAFSPDIRSYAVPDGGYENDRLTIAAVGESGSSIEFLDSSDSVLGDLDDMAIGHQVYLIVGVTVVKIRVSKGDDAQDYSLSITRAKPIVSVRALTVEPAIEGDEIEFEVMRSSAAGDVVAVKFALGEVGTSVGVDPGDILPDSQEGTTHSVTIPANETTATVEVTTVSDRVWEDHSRVEIKLVEDDSYTVHPTNGTTSILVQDDEFVASVAALSAAPNPVGEGDGKAVATVTVTTMGDKLPHDRVAIPVTTSDGTATAGSDFTALETNLTFAEGDFSGVEVDEEARFRASKSVDVLILQDTLDEEDETFALALGTPSDTLITSEEDSKSVTVTITDDDLPVLAALSVSQGALTPAFSPGQNAYTVPDVGYGTHLATINVMAESGAEVSFLDSSDNDYGDLDDMAEGHQVYLNIGSTTIKIRVEKGDDMQNYTLVFTRAKPTVSIRAVTVGPATEDDTLKFEVSRSEAAGDPLEVRVGMDEVDIVEGGGHGDMLPDSVEGTFPLRTIEVDQTSLVFMVETVGDVVWEKHSSIEMSIKPESWYDIDSDKGTASIVVRDDDFPESTASLAVSPNPVGEGTGNITATVSVTTDDARMPHGQVSIPISTSDGTATAGEDYTLVASSLIFKEADFEEVEEDGDTLYRASKSLGITILTDDMDEDEETFNVELGTANRSTVDIEPETKSVTVTIKDQNSKPVVTVSTTPSTPVVSGRSTINLDGTSTDSDNDTLTYAWTTDPANVGIFGDATVEDTTWTAPAPLSAEQSVTLMLTVTDDGTPTGVTTVEVTVTVEANQPPRVEITSVGGVVNGGEAVMLGARASDPEAGGLQYEWSGGGIFADGSVKDAEWTAPAASDVDQTFTLTLTATDELGLTASDSVEFIVPAFNRVPIFPDEESGERDVDEGTVVGAKVGVPVAATDEDGDPLTYTLEGKDAALFNVDDTGQISVAAGTTLDYEAKVEYAVEVAITDGRDEEGEIDDAIDITLSVTIRVRDVEEVGAVGFSAQGLRVGEEVRVGVLDPDNYETSNTAGLVDDTDVTSWVWERSESVDGPWAAITDAQGASYVPTVEDKDNYLRVTASYTDRRGPDKSATGVSGRVGAGENSPPAVYVSPDLAIINGCGILTLSGRASDPDGDTLSFSWSALPDVGHFVDGSKESTVWSASDLGESSMTVELTLTVSDGQGGTVTDSVIVTVRGGLAGARTDG